MLRFFGGLRYNRWPRTAGGTCRRRSAEHGRRLNLTKGRNPRMSASTPSSAKRPTATTRIPLRTADQQAKQMHERLEMSTAEIGLSVRTTNCLEERGIFTVADLLHCTRDDLLAISNFGEKTLEEVYKSLEKI